MTKRITISKLDAMKASGDKFVMITAYDATFARLASEAGADPFATPKKAEPNPLKGSYWFTPARLGQLVDIQDYLESLPETGKVLSIATTYEQ